ncbi:MAG: hypothetical protein IPK26_28230 [Planctomycetes bacterium]|nr:hypothetical protein [Planctomycetota bacterium]
MTDAQLFEEAFRRYQTGDYPEAWVRLWAYRDRQPEVLLRDRQHAAQVAAAMEFCRAQVLLLGRGQAAGGKVDDPRPSKPSGGATVPAVAPPGLAMPGQPSPTYILAVRGGGDLSIAVVGPTRAGSGMVVDVTFRRSGTIDRLKQQPAMLAPGHAHWLDRAVATQEPATLRISESVLGPQNLVVRLERGGNAAVSGPAWLAALSSDTSVLFLHVFNDREGKFVVTRIDESVRVSGQGGSK